MPLQAAAMPADEVTGRAAGRAPDVSKLPQLLTRGHGRTAAWSCKGIRIGAFPPPSLLAWGCSHVSHDRCGAHFYPLPSKSTTDLPQALCSQSGLAKHPGSHCGKLSGPNPRWRKQLALQLGPGGEDAGPGMWLSWARSL